MSLQKVPFCPIGLLSPGKRSKIRLESSLSLSTKSIFLIYTVQCTLGWVKNYNSFNSDSWMMGWEGRSHTHCKSSLGLEKREKNLEERDQRAEGTKLCPLCARHLCSLIDATVADGRSVPRGQKKKKPFSHFTLRR